ncbi:MAG TPA: SurA N-terminal domain-containing protein [Xanthobacteraceae bacterium]|nr:SurA N-terminal domain-containing protein [Xanthobacteraceae bacterium]
MSQIRVRARHGAAARAALVLLGALAFAPMHGTVARAQEVVLLVDGQPITALDIEQRTKFIAMSTHRTPTRQEVIDGLIDETLEIREAKRYTIDPSDADVNDAFNTVASNMNIDSQKLTQILVSGGASAATLKHKLRAQMAWNSLVRGRYKASLEIPDSDVEAQMHLHDAADANQVGYEYILRPVLLVVPRGSPDSAFDARKKEAEALRARFADCNSGISFARALREVAVRDPVSKSSADFSDDIRKILDSTDLGHLTPPEQTSEGIQMFAVCSKRESKNDSPGMQKMRAQLFEQKFGAKAKRYLAELRQQAMIEYKEPQQADTASAAGRPGVNRR